MAGQGAGHDREGGPVVPPELLHQAAEFQGHAVPEQVGIHARQGPAQVIPEPAKAAPDLLHRRPVDAPIQGAHQAQAQVRDHVLEQEQGFHAGVYLRGDAGLQLLSQAGQGFFQAPWPWMARFTAFI
jgi:hypothetical protein